MSLVYATQEVLFSKLEPTEDLTAHIENIKNDTELTSIFSEIADYFNMIVDADGSVVLDIIEKIDSINVFTMTDASDVTQYLIVVDGTDYADAIMTRSTQSMLSPDILSEFMTTYYANYLSEQRDSKQANLFGKGPINPTRHWQ